MRGRGPCASGKIEPEPTVNNAKVPAKGSRLRNARGWIALFVLLGAFAGLYSALSQLRFEEFYAGNWDLGINMQLLWTNTHGYLLFETGDYEFALDNIFI